jgi:hypothetical protein
MPGNRSRIVRRLQSGSSLTSSGRAIARASARSGAVTTVVGVEQQG